MPVAKSNTPEYKTFWRIRMRTENPKTHSYHHYGGRGIKLCEGWRDFWVFFNDLGYRPTSEHSIDRIDNNGHYSCGHCHECRRNGWPKNARWATRVEQGRNRRNNRLLKYKGRTQTITDWARELGVRTDSLSWRLNAGWSLKRAMSEPYRQSKKATSATAL